MTDINQPLNDITEIRAMMERSSKVLSLSGLSGVSAGINALAGTLYVPWILDRLPPEDAVPYLAADALAVLLLSIGLAVMFSRRMARRKGLPVWTATSRLLIIDLAFPLGAGGLLCLSLVFHQVFDLIPGTMLVFYGLALISSSKYALREIRYLGVTDLALGCAAIFFPRLGLALWGTGFGIMHIAYGLLMYYRYER